MNEPKATQEYEVSCPCGDILYVGTDLAAARRASAHNIDDRYQGVPNRWRARTIMPWVEVPPL